MAIATAKAEATTRTGLPHPTHTALNSTLNLATRINYMTYTIVPLKHKRL